MLKTKVGIKAFDAYLPPIEIDQAEIIELAQGNRDTAHSLGIEKKRLAQPSDDTLTIGVETVLNLLKKVAEPNVGALYLGTETPTYSVGNTAAGIAEFCGLTGHDLKTADLEFACRAGSLAMIAAIGHVQAFDTDAIAVAADIAKGRPGDVLAMTTGAGAASFLLSSSLDNALAEIYAVHSYTHRRSDFWRAQEEPFPRHAGRYSNQMYETTLTQSIEGFCQQTGESLSNFDHVIVHQPNGKMPYNLARKLQISDAQLELGFSFNKTGNLYAAMTPFSLSKVLNQAKANQKVLVASYGSGAGSDVIALQTTDLIEQYQQNFSLNLQPFNILFK